MENAKNKLLLDRIRGNTDKTPVWLMRQAGRYLPEYRQLKEKHSFLELCKSPELAKEISLQPLHRFNVDAVICFSDILVIPEALGMKLDFVPAPVFDSPLQKSTDFFNLNFNNVTERISHILNTLKLLKKELANTEKTLIGFSGAPYTLFAYMFEKNGSKQFEAPRILANQEPAVFDRIMQKLAEVVTEYLSAQHQAGADLVQIFDTWAGTLSAAEYRRFIFKPVKQIITSLKKQGIPVALYVNGTPHLIKELVAAEPDIISLDWRMELKDCLNFIPENMAVQGNLDPAALFGDPEEVYKKTAAIIQQATGRKNHILNLGHGILPQTPVENVAAFIKAARD
jgi:uroporphyrinogen decarboxylase